MNQVCSIIYAHPYTKYRKGVAHFHALPSSSIISSNPAANLLTSLGLALLALKTAHDMVPTVGAYKERCASLVDLCVQLMVNTCSQIEADSPMPHTSDLTRLEKYAVNLISNNLRLT